MIKNMEKRKFVEIIFNEKEIDNIEPSKPSNFGIKALYS